MYSKPLSDAQERIVKEAKAERQPTAAGLKIREKVQEDEQTRINKYAEGFCYGCAKTDRITSSLYYICEDCMHKRGAEGLMAIVSRKRVEELCDFCGLWRKGYKNGEAIFQVNISLCFSCQMKIIRLHRKYREEGGRKRSPYHRFMEKEHGKDWLLQTTGARKINI